MYVCVCEAVTEDDVELAVLAGAQTLEAVTASTGAGSNCGSCHDTIEGVIERTCALRSGAAFEVPCARRETFANSLGNR